MRSTKFGAAVFVLSQTAAANAQEILFSLARRSRMSGNSPGGHMCLAILLAAGLTGCGGGGNDGGNPVAPDLPLTLAETAPSLAKTVASVIVGALEGSASAANVSAPQPALARLFALLAPTLYAQSAFTKSCPAGGSVRIERVVMSSGRYTMSGSPATFAGCGFNPGRKGATMNGALTLNGVWCPGQSSCSGPSIGDPTMPVGLTGNLDVSDVGSVPLGGSIGLTAYAIPIAGAGIQNGKPDTPPPPNPNSCGATVAPSSVSAGAGGGGFTVSVTVGATCPWTAASGSGFISVTSGASGSGNGSVSFSVAANTGAARSGSLSIAGQTVTVSQAAGQTTTALNLTGTWTEVLTGGTQTMILTQSGSSLSGRAIGAAVAGVIQSSSVSGTVSGSSVSLTENDTIFTSSGGVSVSCQISVLYKLTAPSSSSMSGSYSYTGTCSITGLPPGVPVPPVPPISGAGTATFTKQ